MEYQLGRTAVRLPLKGVASSNLADVRAPLIHPFWLLVGIAGMLIGCSIVFRIRFW
jgi:hypothetical protein